MLGLVLKILQGALGLASLGLLLSLAMTLSPLALSSTPDLQDVGEGVDAAAQPSREQPRYGVIAERNLFASRQEPEAPEPVQEEIVESALNAQLIATLAPEGAGRTESVALVRDVDGNVVTVTTQAPDNLFAKGAARVVSIEQRRVVIEHQGKLEAILLDVDAQAQPQERRARRRPERAQPRAVERRMRAGMSSSGEMLALMRNLRQQGRFAAERDEDGNLSGIRVTRINDGSALSNLGVEPGDRISAVNGVPLSGESAGIGVMASIVAGADPVLTVQDASGRGREVVIPRDVLSGLIGQAR